MPPFKGPNRKAPSGALGEVLAFVFIILHYSSQRGLLIMQLPLAPQNLDLCLILALFSFFIGKSRYLSLFFSLLKK